MESKIAIQNLSKTFATNNREINVTSNLSMNITEGRFIAIVGPSGCGKTTLLRLLAGLIRPTSGTIRINSGCSGFVFQEYSLFPWLTVEENILVGKNSQRGLLKRYLELAGLTDYRNFYPKNLSGGMKQKVAILRAILNNPKIILMDEPFAALDVDTKHSMQQILLELWNESKQTVIFVTHDIEEAIYLADEVIVLSDKPIKIKARVDVSLKNNLTFKILKRLL